LGKKKNDLNHLNGAGREVEAAQAEVEKSPKEKATNDSSPKTILQGLMRKGSCGERGKKRGKVLGYP